MSEIGAGVDLRVRVQPGRRLIPGRVKERSFILSPLRSLSIPNLRRR
jgi:hypothetical protein